jgi:hypothetical protein
VKKIIGTSFLAALTFTMLLPVAGRVNAASIIQSVARQGGNPLPGGNGGGHYQGGNPLPGGNGGGHYQGGNPLPGGNGGGH